MAGGIRSALGLRFAAYLLGYPGNEAFRSVWDERRALARASSAEAARAMAILWETPFSSLPRIYVETFDHSEARPLYLTAYELGDDRSRGGALVELGRLLGRFGYLPPDGELPDFIPMLLELAAVCPSARGELVGRLSAAVGGLVESVPEENPYAAVLALARTSLGARAAAPRRPSAPPDIEGLPYPLTSD